VLRVMSADRQAASGDLVQGERAAGDGAGAVRPAAVEARGPHGGAFDGRERGVHHAAGDRGGRGQDDRQPLVAGDGHREARGDGALAPGLDQVRARGEAFEAERAVAAGGGGVAGGVAVAPVERDVDPGERPPARIERLPGERVAGGDQDLEIRERGGRPDDQRGPAAAQAALARGDRAGAGAQVGERERALVIAGHRGAAAARVPAGHEPHRRPGHRLPSVPGQDASREARRRLEAQVAIEIARQRDRL
jgi:hypothetical protein